MRALRKHLLIGSLLLSGCNNTAQPTLLPISSEETMQLFLFSRSHVNGFDGHGFVVKREGQRPLGVTAYHVAGPYVPPADPDAPVPAAWLHTIVDSSVVVRLGQRLNIVGAQTISSTSSQRDVAAYPVLDFIPERALELAPDLPAVADTVYVLALHTGDDPRSGPRRHPARVLIASDEELRYVYLHSANANMTSGAAVLDRAGRVVGLNVGTIVTGPQVHGLAVGVKSLRSLLPD